jgi:hypothetical protein
LEVPFEVLDVFDADGDPNQPVREPIASRSPGGIAAWVIAAGCSMRLSTPPRLSARVKTSVAETA